MPFIELFVPEHKSSTELERISNILHEQLVAHFDVPIQDKFHVFHRITSGRRFFDLHYGVSNGQRSENWMLIKILAGKPRSLEAKQALYQALSNHFKVQLGLVPADLMIVISFNQLNDWSFSEGQIPSSKNLNSNPAN
ncbi:tautomerase family protein [Marinomonas transparens]|uniref:Tautomerase family protein n=1 Tax=Marinomonas transparens TaxID=2795388 RepID=A0A934N4T8_9GAMM|nr:tautomerase family protein [Marinomonas transparens]MBJ7536351.1 tautomerase family protein [Marinomonas transparens]